MNIFYLDRDPKLCAEMHVNKHVVKMILEYAQLLSTAHRVLDGTLAVGVSQSGRKKTLYQLPDDRDTKLYSATHVNHPSAVWARKSYQNYAWLHQLLHQLCIEYTHRYGKIHKVQLSGLLYELYAPPTALESTDHITFTEPTPAMPDEYKVHGNSIQSYRNYYVGAKSAFAVWKSRITPDWFASMLHSKSNIGKNDYAHL